MPDFFISSSAMPSSLATAFSTAFSGSGIAGTNGGGTSDCGGRRRRCRFSRLGVAPATSVSASRRLRTWPVRHDAPQWLHLHGSRQSGCARVEQALPCRVGLPPPTHGCCHMKRGGASTTVTLGAFGYSCHHGSNFHRGRVGIDTLPRLGHHHVSRPPGRRRAEAARPAPPTDAAPAGTWPSGWAPAIPSRPRRCRGARGRPLQGSCGCPATPGDTRRSVAASGRKAHGPSRFRRNSWCSRCRRRRTRGAAALRSPMTPTAWCCGRTAARRSAGRVCTPASARLSRWLSCQSSSTMRPSGIPHLRRCAPTPSGTTNGARWRAGQADDRVDVEVVVVVVADQHRVDGGQRLQRYGHLVHALRADRVRRRDSDDSTPGRRARGSRRSRSSPRSARTS